jgi:hypothetical protein
LPFCFVSFGSTLQVAVDTDGPCCMVPEVPFAPCPPVSSSNDKAMVPEATQDGRRVAQRHPQEFRNRVDGHGDFLAEPCKKSSRAVPEAGPGEEIVTGVNKALLKLH